MINKFFLAIIMSATLAHCGFSPIYIGSSKEVIISKLEIIGDEFLYYCYDLEEINLLNLKNLKTIGEDFLNSCENLKEINLSQLVNLEYIGDYFLSNCNKLEKIIVNNKKMKLFKKFPYLSDKIVFVD
jgi:hypothetical protein